MKYVWNRRETFFSGYVSKRKSSLEALATKILSLGCEPGKKTKYIMYLMSNCMSLLLLSNYIWLTENLKKRSVLSNLIMFIVILFLKRKNTILSSVKVTHSFTIVSSMIEMKLHSQIQRELQKLDHPFLKHPVSDLNLYQ
jgi:hypothetical protein